MTNEELIAIIAIPCDTSVANEAALLAANELIARIKDFADHRRLMKERN